MHLRESRFTGQVIIDRSCVRPSSRPVPDCAPPVDPSEALGQPLQIFPICRLLSTVTLDYRTESAAIDENEIPIQDQTSRLSMVCRLTANAIPSKGVRTRRTTSGSGATLVR